jgi:flagellar hook-associated protein FlgK
MSVALTYSLAGMQAATDRVAIRANNIANVSTPGYRAADVVQEATQSGPVVSSRPPLDASTQFASAAIAADGTQSVDSQSQSLTANSASTPVTSEEIQASFYSDISDVVLEAELVDMMAAEYAYKASAQVTRTVGQMQDTLLDIFI